MGENLTQEEANIRLAAAGVAMADIGQSVVQIVHTAARMAQNGMDISNAGHQFRWQCNDCGHKCDELYENGVTEEQAYCPMCGSDDVAYIKSSAKPKER